MMHVEGWVGGKSMPIFRLDKEPWIPVVGTDGTEREANLVEVFEQAPSIRQLSGTPLEVAVILRLLLAIAHLTETPPNLARWGELWQDRVGFMRRCAAYVREQGNVWDLFHPEQPFLQDNRLAKVGGEPVEPTFLSRGKVGADAFVSHTSAADLALLPAAAARALLVTHAFSVGGTGTPNPLLPKRPGKKNEVNDKYSKSSLLAQSLVVFLNDPPLDRTLLLNLLASAKVCEPGWHFPSATTADPVGCKGITDRYTRPAASVLLYPNEDGSVSRATVTIGCTFLRPNPKANEPGDAIDDPMLPHDGKLRQLEFEPQKAFWRSAHTFFATKGRPLALISQLQKLRMRELVDSDAGALRIVGISGDRGKVKHYFWRDETLPFGLSVIADDERYAAMQRAIDDAKDAEQKICRRLRNFARAYLGLDSEDREKGDPKKEAEQIRGFIGELVGFKREKWGKDTVTIPLYTDFWAALAPSGERIACDKFDETAWAALLKKTSEDTFRRAIDRLPPDARRHRAQFFRGESSDKSKQKGATV